MSFNRNCSTHLPENTLSFLHSSILATSPFVTQTATRHTLNLIQRSLLNSSTIQW